MVVFGASWRQLEEHPLRLLSLGIFSIGPEREKGNHEGLLVVRVEPVLVPVLLLERELSCRHRVS